MQLFNRRYSTIQIFSIFNRVPIIRGLMYSDFERKGIIKKKKLKHTFCKFPYYSLNCSQQLRSEQIPNTKITVGRKSWIYFYYRVEQAEYQLLIENGKSDVGVSLVPFNISHSTKLPSFNSYFNLIPQEYIYQVKLKRQGNESESVLIIGFYNFNQTSEAEINLSLEEIITEDVFPIWGIMVIIGVIVLAILIIIYLAIQFRRQLKVLSLDIPEIGIEILDKYMPSKKAQVEMLNDFCCIVRIKQNFILSVNILFLINYFIIIYF